MMLEIIIDHMGKINKNQENFDKNLDCLDFKILPPNLVLEKTFSKYKFEKLKLNSVIFPKFAKKTLKNVGYQNLT